MSDSMFAEWRERVERALDRFLPAADSQPRALHEAMRYAIFGGGKRLRPICCLLACDAVAGDSERAMAAACALEMIHTYSLVHDDLPCMDDDDLRRGRKTVHVVYGEAMGVLVGDALLTRAFEVVATELLPPIAARVAAVLARGAGSCGMVGGQVDDLAAEGKETALEAVLAIDRAKTAALFSAAFESGACCAGADAATVSCLAEIGLHLGVAFQVVDDILDQTASPEKLGKATGKDAARGKATLPSLIGRDAAFARARSESETALRMARTLPRPRLIEALIGTMLGRTF